MHVGILSVYNMHTVRKRKVLEEAAAFLLSLSPYFVPPPSPVSLHKQTVTATQREERLRDWGKEGAVLAGEGGIKTKKENSKNVGLQVHCTVN
jgi:hypothetical protein